MSRRQEIEDEIIEEFHGVRQTPDEFWFLIEKISEVKLELEELRQDVKNIGDSTIKNLSG